MKLLLKRTIKADEYTVGELYINDQYICDTLEDTDRELTDDMSTEKIKNIKIKGQTAIPIGSYIIEITYSPKFKKDLPLLHNVKGFEGIRIHSGNTNKDTEGCILVGTHSSNGYIKDSRIAFNKLMDILQNTDEAISIEIV